MKANKQLSFSPWYTITNTRSWSNQSICKVWSCYVQRFRGRCINKKVHYFTFDFDLRSRTDTKRCPVSSTSYDLCTCKVWSCYVQQFRRKCIHKKIHYLTSTPRSRGSRSHEMLPSTHDIMWPMHQQSLMLLHLMVKKMHLQENTLFDLDLGVKVSHTKCCPVSSTACALCTSKVWCCYTPRLRRRYIYKKHIIWHWPRGQGHMKCCPVPSTSCDQFEVTMSKGLGVGAFTRKFIIWPWTWGQGHMKWCPVPSSSCDLCSYKVWNCYVLRFRRRYIYKKKHYLTFDLGLEVKVTRNVAQYHLYHVTYSATNMKLLRLTV